MPVVEIEIAAESFLDLREGEKSSAEADDSYGQCRLARRHRAFQVRETRGREDRGAANEIRDRRRDRSANVRSELFGRHRDENRPVTDAETDRERESVDHSAREPGRVQINRGDQETAREESRDRFTSAAEVLTHETRRQIADREADRAEQDRITGAHRALDVQAGGELGGERHQNAGREIDRDADQNTADVAPRFPAREDDERIAARNFARMRFREHTRLRNLESREQERDPHQTTGDVRRFPIEMLADESGGDDAEHSESRDDRRSETALFLRQRLRDEGDRSTQLACEPHATEEAAERIAVRIPDESVREVRERVKQDRAEHHGESALLVGEHSPNDSTHHHAGHLRVVDENALLEESVAGVAESFERRSANHAEEGDVEEVDEVAEARDDDREIQNRFEVFQEFHETGFRRAGPRWSKKKEFGH